MKIIGILLIIVRIAGMVMIMMMFGDIGIACMAGAVSALLSGFGFLSANKKIAKCNKKRRNPLRKALSSIWYW